MELSLNNTVNAIEIQDAQGVYRTIPADALIAGAQACVAQRFKRGATINSPDKIKETLHTLLAGREQEVFYALWMDTKHRVIKGEELFFGTINSSTVHPREVVKAGLACNAAAVIFGHNHVSGDTRPSVPDINITEVLVNALRIMDIRVLDHLITGVDVTSMAELGYL